MEKSNFTRRIAEGGLLVSLAFIFYLISFIFPALWVVSWLCVTTIIIGVVKYGNAQGLKIALATALLIGFLIGVVYGVSFLLNTGLIGLALGICLRKNIKTFNTILITFIVSLVCLSLDLLFTLFFIDSKAISQLLEGAKSALLWLCSQDIIKNSLLDISHSFGLSERWISMEWVPSLVMDLLPSLLIFIAFYYVIYFWFLNVFLLKRLNIPLPDNVMMEEFPLLLLIPPWFLVFLLSGILCLIVNSYMPLAVCRIAGVNLITLMLITGFAKGVFSINLYLQPKLPADKKLRLILGFAITLLEFTIFILPVILFGFYSIGAGVQNGRLHEYLGTNYLRAGKLELAIAHYKKSLESNPRRALTHKLIGIAYHHKGNSDLAMSHLNKSIELAGKSGKTV